MPTVSIILTVLTALFSLTGLILSIVCLSRTKKQDISDDLARQRNELNARMDSMQNSLSASVTAGLNAGNTAQMNAITKFSQETQATLNTFATRIDRMNDTTEKRLMSIQEENRKKLDEMQGVVNEKLETALEKKVTESFKLVNERLELVSKGLTEMQGLANGVGDLKKILSNVKTRGIFGEIQLSRILEQILTPDQYDENVATIPGSLDRVEFAVRLPGKDSDGSIIYLPIDSKFPMDRYEQLEAAAESGDPILLETARKSLAAFLKMSAKDIHDKYIRPPHTTDFGILFLPTEGLYAEVVRMTDLTEALMRDYSINVAGPSTLAALLNSLQMGFRTLAIEKRTNDVWNILGAVKTEFGTFETVLENVKKRLEGAGNDLEKLVGTRTRAIRRKLRDVESLPSETAQNLLSDGGFDIED
ncbi:MAG: DNA recombination protein RmuC [Clostridia bacterium]|nr:DNA recombination protein RmuC [Clostridia bacterium]MBQ1965281.1 DNA recombination protein RmuC [Clostridia bacterium]MBQ5743084.1 DNA recombination protein RmuC [Clostridia bacterium]